MDPLHAKTSMHDAADNHHLLVDNNSYWCFQIKRKLAVLMVITVQYNLVVSVWQYK